MRRFAQLYALLDASTSTRHKLESLREFLGTLGIKVPTGQRLRPADAQLRDYAPCDHQHFL